MNVMIISNKYDEIKTKVHDYLERGTTIIEAMGGSGPFPGLLQGGQKHGSKDSNNGDNNKQFDQGEARDFHQFSGGGGVSHLFIPF